MTQAALGGAGSRAFWLLVGLAVALRGAVAYVACCLSMALIWQFVHRGSSVLWSAPAWAGATLLALSLFGATRSAGRLRRGVVASRRVEREVRRRAVEPTVALRKLGTGMEGGGGPARVTVVDSPAPFAFTYGLLKPRIALSRGLLAATGRAELEAVLAHEREHVRGRDPLRGLIATTLVARHIAFPLFGQLREAFAADRELAADRHAVIRCGTSAVAGALLKATDTPGWAQTAPAAAMGSQELLEARLVQLEQGRPHRPARSSGRQVGAAIGGVVMYAAVLAGSALLISSTPVLCMAG